MGRSSEQRNIWRRLKKNRGALGAMVVIALALLGALFAYLLAPDGTPGANRMIVEIGGRRPGSAQRFLLLKKPGSQGIPSFLSGLLFGRPDGVLYVPVDSVRLAGDSLVATRGVEEDLLETKAYPAAALAIREADRPAGYTLVTRRFWLGTDKYGRDILSRLLVGLRVSLAVGTVTVLISLSIGVLLGALAGYYRGRTDQVVMWLVNVLWSIPTLLLVFAITLMLGKGFWQVFVAIGLTMWVSVARIIRGQVLGVRELEYVEAARALGFSNARIIARHILPNVMGPVLVVSASNFASAIVMEAGLSFLGVGVQPPQPSWGLMIKENYNFIITHNPMLALAPGLAIMVLVLAFNMLGNGLRDALNVRD